MQAQIDDTGSKGWTHIVKASEEVHTPTDDVLPRKYPHQKDISSDVERRDKNYSGCMGGCDNTLVIIRFRLTKTPNQSTVPYIQITSISK